LKTEVTENQTKTIQLQSTDFYKRKVFVLISVTQPNWIVRITQSLNSLWSCHARLYILCMTMRVHLSLSKVPNRFLGGEWIIVFSTIALFAIRQGQSHKAFWCKFTHSFWKLYLFTRQKNYGYINKMVWLTKSVSKFTPKRFMRTTLRIQSYKTLLV
jgi:hypothetical protein